MSLCNGYVGITIREPEETIKELLETNWPKPG